MTIVLESEKSMDKGQRLIEAAKKDDVEGGVRWINLGADVNTRDENGNTALHWTGFNGDTHFAELLTKNGADVLAANDANWTPRDTAMWNHRSETADFLRRKEAEVRQQHVMDIAKGNAKVINEILRTEQINDIIRE